MKIHSVFILGLCLGTIASQSLSASEKTIGWLCEPCTSFAAAREQAIQHAPALQCGNLTGNYLDPDSGSDCKAPPAKQVILGHPASKTVYVFEVTWTDESGIWAPLVTSSWIAPEKLQLAEEALYFLDDWRHFIADVNSRWAREQGFSPGSLPVYTQQKNYQGIESGDALDCPQDTALRTLMDKSRFDALQAELRQEAERALRKYIQNGGTVTSAQVSLGPPHANLVFRVGDSGGAIPTAVARYFLQRETSLVDNVFQNDRLVWSIEASGHQESVFGIDLSAVYAGLALDMAKSTVLGIQADKVFTQSDNFWESPPEITDPCALEALAEGAEEIPGSEYRDRDTGAVVNPTDTFLSGGHMTTPGGGAGTVQLCLYDFYSNDVYQFSAWLPCGEESEKEQIKE